MNITTLVLKGTDVLRKNQYPIGKISAIDFRYIQSNHQLIIKAQARPSSGEGFPYQTQIVFSGILWSDKFDQEKFPIRYDSDNGMIFLSQPTVESRIQLRCGCPDDRFMWQFSNKKNKSLLGTMKPYVRKTTWMPPRNPTETPGMCKHTLGLIKILMNNGLVKKDAQVQAYLNRPVRRQQ